MLLIHSLDDLTTALSNAECNIAELIDILEDVIGMEAAKLEVSKLFGDTEQRFISEITISKSKILLSFLRMQNDTTS